MALTHGPDPVHLLAGAGTAAEQAARPRLVADHGGGGYVEWADKAAAGPGDAFVNEPTVTASDATNAAKLAGLGYVAAPTTAWTVGQSMTVNGFAFHWSGTAWAAGAAPVGGAQTQASPPPEPTETP